MQRILETAGDGIKAFRFFRRLQILALLRRRLYITFVLSILMVGRRAESQKGFFFFFNRTDRIYRPGAHSIHERPQKVAAASSSSWTYLMCIITRRVKRTIRRPGIPACASIIRKRLLYYIFIVARIIDVFATPAHKHYRVKYARKK